MQKMFLIPSIEKWLCTTLESYILAISTILSNTYQKPIRLFVTGGEEIQSTEGITQGDPLAMAMYALAISPLIQKLKVNEPNVKQVWFAEDSITTGKVRTVRIWRSCLTTIGPKIGYYPNPRKTHLVVKQGFLDEARNMFEGTGIKLSISAYRRCNQSNFYSCTDKQRTMLRRRNNSSRRTSLNIINTTTITNAEFNTSQKICEPLKAMIIDRRKSFTKPRLQSIKNDLHKKEDETANSAMQVRGRFPQTKQRMMDLACEKGASS